MHTGGSLTSESSLGRDEGNGRAGRFVSKGGHSERSLGKVVRRTQLSTARPGGGEGPRVGCRRTRAGHQH